MNKQIKINVTGEPTTVDAIDIQGDFALHKALSGRTLNVTHVPTGWFIVNGIPSKAKGMKCLKMLAEAPSFSEGLSRVAAIKKELA